MCACACVPVRVLHVCMCACVLQAWGMEGGQAPRTKRHVPADSVCSSPTANTQCRQLLATEHARMHDHT